MKQNTKLKKKKKVQKVTKEAKNKRSFDEVIGDPYGWPEPIDGQYEMLKGRSSISIADPQGDVSCPVNRARPTTVDFVIDIESAVDDGLTAYAQENPEAGIGTLKYLFDNTYFLGSGQIFNQQERSKIEQIIGGILRERHISPVTKYFTIVKQ